MLLGEHMTRELPIRKHIRLKGYDYSKKGRYFITICVKGRHEMFGRIVAGRMFLSDYGKIAKRNIVDLSLHVEGFKIEKFVVMPNHVHMIMFVYDHIGTRYIASADKTTKVQYEQKQQSLHEQRAAHMASIQMRSKKIVPKAIQQYKASVTRDTGIYGLWQPRFHDHIIRDEEEYKYIWHYIDNNPARWEEDCFYVPTKR